MKVVQHNPNCAIFRRGDLHAWCDCGAEAPVLEEIRRKVWHKIGADAERAAIVRFLEKEKKALLRSDSIYDGWAADTVAELATRIEEGQYNEEE